MKIFALITAAIMSVGASALAGEQVATNASEKSVTVQMVVMEGDKVLFRDQVSTPDGKLVSTAQITTITYIAEASRDADGKVALVQGDVKTGWSWTFMPTVDKTSGNIVMRFKIGNSELVSINRFTFEDIAVEQPVVTSQDILQEFVMVSGREMQLPFGSTEKPPMAKYTVKLVAIVI